MSNVSSKDNKAQPDHKKGDAITWGPTAAILMTLVAFLAAYVGADLLAYLVPHILGWNSAQADKWFNSVSGQFVFVAIAESLTFGTILAFLHRRKTTIKALGFKRRPVLNDAIKAVVAYLIYFAAVLVITSVASALVHLNVDQKQELGFDTVVGLGDKLMTFFSLVILPPIVEEILFRGFLFTGLRTKLSFRWVAVIVSLIFASLHLAEASDGILWVAGLDTFILSLVLCYLREKTGNLWAGILVHALKNGIAFFFLYVVATA
ncbi:MAG TPA: CPBP family intramembrane glutamic endopeptidase [Patescibacteria group bacterium]|jgi:membrane protease YdiL (CAAX protease family)|nr:CPBP family intramembrane glutamic endopeptidase [Patescibacteria group bacterium]